MMQSLASDKWIIDFSLVFRFFSFIVSYLSFFTLVFFFNTILYGTRVVGKKHLKTKTKKGCFLISNHSLELDPTIVEWTIFPRRAYFSAMQKTFKRGFIGPYIRLLGAFPIPENFGVLQIKRPIETALERGRFVHFFPEGDIFPDGKMEKYSQRIEPYYDGVFYFACLFNVPVIPVTIVIKERKLFGKILPHPFTKITVVVSEPIYPEANILREKRRIFARQMAEKARSIMENILTIRLQSKT